MNSPDLLDTLDFEDQFVFDEDVNSVATIEPDVLNVSKRRTIPMA